MFEFSRFWPGDYEYVRDFVSDLGKFFGNLPKGWRYCVEMSNKHWLVAHKEDVNCVTAATDEAALSDNLLNLLMFLSFLFVVEQRSDSAPSKDSNAQV